MKETKTGATSGVFRTNMTVWDSLYVPSKLRMDEEQHEQPSQRFAQQLLTASVDKANYDIIKSGRPFRRLMQTDPHDEDNANTTTGGPPGR